MGSLLKLLLPLLLCATAMGTVIFNRNNGYCVNLPPGVRRMTRGVDITELDMLPLRVVGGNGYKSPVVKMKCYKPRYWYRNGNKYQLPDQVWMMTSTPTGLFWSDAQLYKTSDDVRQSMVKTVGLKGKKHPKYSFSYGKSFIYMESQILNSSVYFADTSAIDAESRVDLIPHWSLELDDYAEDYLNNVIKNTPYSYNPQAYHDFIKQFGTHYFGVARFGGRIRVVQRIDSSYYTANSEEKITKHIRENFHQVIANHLENKNKQAFQVDSDFEEATTYTIRYYGGDTNLLASDGIQAWQPTVEADPWLLSGQVRPISDLIRNDVQREGVRRAIWQHVLRRYLEEMRRKMFSRKPQLGSRMPSLESRLKDLFDRTMGGLDETEVDALRDEIDRD